MQAHLSVQQKKTIGGQVNCTEAELLVTAEHQAQTQMKQKDFLGWLKNILKIAVWFA